MFRLIVLFTHRVACQLIHVCPFRGFSSSSEAPQFMQTSPKGSLTLCKSCTQILYCNCTEFAHFKFTSQLDRRSFMTGGVHLISTLHCSSNCHFRKHWALFTFSISVAVSVEISVTSSSPRRLCNPIAKTITKLMHFMSADSNKPQFDSPINHTIAWTVMSSVNRLLIFIYCRDCCAVQLEENSSSLARAMNFNSRREWILLARRLFYFVERLWSNRRPSCLILARISMGEKDLDVSDLNASGTSRLQFIQLAFYDEIFPFGIIIFETVSIMLWWAIKAGNDFDWFPLGNLYSWLAISTSRERLFGHFYSNELSRRGTNVVTSLNFTNKYSVSES